MKRRADVIDLTTERAARLPAATRFVLEARDAGSDAEQGCFLWDWTIEDRADTGGQYRPSARQVAAQLRRVADRYDPRPTGRVHRRRHRVRQA